MALRSTSKSFFNEEEKFPSCEITHNKLFCINIAHVNVQSLNREKLNLLDLYTTDNNIHILCVTEHWICDEGISSMTPNLFRLQSYFLRKNSKHGGVAIFIKTGLIEYLKPKTLTYVNKYCIEGAVELCAVSLSVNKKTLSILSVYRPDNDLDAFFCNITACLSEINKVSDNIICCGDLNIDYLTNSPKRDLLLDIFHSFNLDVKLKSPTRIFTNKNNKTSCSAIDYAVTNLPSAVYSSKMLTQPLADHYGQLISFNINIDNATARETVCSRRDTSEEALKKLSFLFSTENFSCVNYHNVDEAFNEFIFRFERIMNASCPILNYKPRSDRSDNKGWLTSDIIAESNQLKNLHWLKNNIASPQLNTLYKEKKKMLNRNISCAKKRHVSRKIDKSNNKIRAIWNEVNSQLNRKIRQQKITLKFEGRTSTDPEETAEIFAEYFANAPTIKINENFLSGLPVNCTVSVSCPSSALVRPILPSDIIQEIKCLKNTGSSGCDGVTTIILKHIADDLAEPFAALANNSLQKGVFPDILKTAIVVPVHKKLDMEECSNYRPISILSVFAKLLERIVFRQIQSFLNKFNLLTEKQHGFCSGKSIETATYQFIQTVNENMDKGNEVVGLFFDLSMAFDTVNFQFLIKKLHALGIRGVLLDWVQSYITHRKMTVKIENKLSSRRNLWHGVPQGSVLGPLLFLIYINDMPHHISRGSLTIYADDCSVVISEPSLNELMISVTQVLNDFKTWCYNNMLILNTDKTQCVYFSKRKLLSPAQILLFGELGLTMSQDVKFLGLSLDGQLSWSRHVDVICGRLGSSFYAISKLKNSLTTECLIDIYYSLAYSHMSTNIVAWGHASSVHRVFKAQKRIIRLIFGLHARDSCKPYFKSFKILTLPCIFLLKSVIFVKKNPHLFRLVSSSSAHNQSTRFGNSTLRLEMHKSVFFEKSPYYNCARLFNRLPEGLKLSINSNTFVRKFKFILTQKCYYDISEFFSDNDFEIF